MSTDGGGSWATQDQEGAREVPGHRHPYQEILSESDETRPLGATQESPHIKTEPEEPLAEGVSPEEGALSTQRWAPLSRGSKEKTLLLPGGAHRSPQAPALSQEERTRDQQMAAALLTAWSQMPVTFEDVALYLSQEEWGRLDHTQQSFCREALQKRKGLSLGLPLSRPFWASHVQGKGEASSSSWQTGEEEEEKMAMCTGENSGSWGDLIPGALVLLGFLWARTHLPEASCGRHPSSVEGGSHFQDPQVLALCHLPEPAPDLARPPHAPGSLTKASLTVHPLSLKALAPDALGDVKPFRTMAGRGPGGSLQCGQQASSSQGSEQTKEDTLPGSLKQGQPKTIPPATSFLETQEEDIPEKPSEEEKPAAEAAKRSKEALAAEGDGSKKTYKCEQCGKGFSWHSHLVTHRRTHTGEKPYACTDCGKRFGRSSHLIQHQIIHTGEKPYTCPSCWKSFSHHSTLIQHQRIHTGEKPYMCDRCAKRFTRRSDLVTHQGTHTGAKPHKCPVCSKCFTQSSALVTHQRTHTGVKPYPCPECGKCFSQRSNLIAHNRTHTGEKPYCCLDCGKSFSHSSHLTAHQRTHRGVRPYSCPLCGKSFSRRSNLHRHEKIHTTGPKALAMLMLGAAAGALAAPPPMPT